jgi:murein DD-endopeptidase MepM/ murein hydrolase activator NlpD
VSAEVKRLAGELEAMLLTRMLREMREAGRWDSENESDGLGASAFSETFDAELARHLTSVQDLGLAAQLAGPMAAQFGLSTDQPKAGAVSAPPAAVPAAAPAAANGLHFGVGAGSITSQYGWRTDPIAGGQRFHRGIDIRAAYGDTVQAAGPGRVVFSGEQSGYGTTVVIEHEGGVRTRYAHLSAATVQTGDDVAAGAAIGQVGSTGRATGTHLHFEVTVNGQPVAPSEWGLADPTQ